MSIYNRKMFKRNAREKLNQSAGVQTFFNGGLVGGTALGGRRGYIAPGYAKSLGRAAEIDLARRALEGGIGSLNAAEMAALRSNIMGRQGQELLSTRGTLGDTALTSFLEGVGSVGGQIAGGLYGLGEAAVTADEPDQTTIGGAMAGQTPPEDYLRELGFGISDIADVPFSYDAEEMAKKSVADRLEEMRLKEAQRIFEEDTEMRGEPDMGEFEGMPPVVPPKTAPKTAMLEDVPPEEAPATEEAAAAPATEEKAAAAPATEKAAVAPLIATGTEEAAQQTAADQVTETFQKDLNNTVEEPDLEALKKEFMDMIPAYEGTNPGLFLAQIGFTAAAGKSPSAIENISEAMNDVLPFIIKDKKEEKAYRRQLELSGTQYALGEASKHRAALRDAQSKDRNLKYFVATEDIPELGVKKDKLISFTEGDIRNGALSKYPVTDITMYNNDKDNEAIVAKARAELKKQALVDPDKVDKMMAEYTTAAETYNQFGSLSLIVESNIKKVGDRGEDFLGGYGILKEAARKAINTVYPGGSGVLPDDFRDRANYTNDMRSVANQMVRQILGESAKNISNIDRKLADEVSGLVQDLTVGEDPKTVLPKLQRLKQRIDSTRQTAESQMRNFESTWRNSIVKGSGVNVYDIQKATRQELTGTLPPGESAVFAQGGGQTILFSDIVDDQGNFDPAKYQKVIKGIK